MSNKPDKTAEQISEIMLDQSIKEMLYSFHKNGGNLEYCVSEIKSNFKKAGYELKSQIEEETAERIKVEIEKTCCNFHTEHLCYYRCTELIFTSRCPWWQQFWKEFLGE